MEKEFKIGDKVKIVNNGTASKNSIGDVGVLLTWNGSGGRVQVENGPTHSIYHYKSDLEHYQEEIILDVILEEEFVLPERWCVLRTNDNHMIINKWFTDNNHGKPWVKYAYIGIDNFNKYWTNLKIKPDFTEITFEQFKKYVLKEKPIFEPLPFFKVLTGDDNENTIFRVQNNEGNIFEIGDKIRGINGYVPNIKSMIISSFRYNKEKTNICAVTKEFSDYGIGVDKIEHVLEFKKDEIVLDIIEDKIPENESNLDKAKRLYPIGTKYKEYRGTIYTVEHQSFREFNDSMVYGENNKGCLMKDHKWAEIISKPVVKKEPVIITSSLKDMLALQEAGVKDVISIQPETLLEKAKRLYPIGITFIPTHRTSQLGELRKGKLKISYANSILNGDGTSIYTADKGWAEILYNGYKIGDIIQVPRHLSTGNVELIHNPRITKLETINGQEVAFFGEDNKHNRILIKNIKK